jgi:hypothetical protein
MSGPTLEEAVLLAAGYLYRDVEKSWKQPVRLSDITRAVAEVYELPPQKPAQPIDPNHPKESNMVQPAGRDKKVPLEEAVWTGALVLQERGHAKMDTIGADNVLQLTEPGPKEAKGIMGMQDACIELRIQKVSPTDPRLAKRPNPFSVDFETTPNRRSPQPGSRPAAARPTSPFAPKSTSPSAKDTRPRSPDDKPPLPDNKPRGPGFRGPRI